MNQSMSLLKARIKLQQRHLQEWDSLVINQQKVLALIREENGPKFSLIINNKLAFVDLTRKQTARLTKLMGRQFEERLRMKERHQQEKISLGQAAGQTEENSN